MYVCMYVCMYGCVSSGADNARIVGESTFINTVQNVACAIILVSGICNIWCKNTYYILQQVYDITLLDMYSKHFCIKCHFLCAGHE